MVTLESGNNYFAQLCDGMWQSRFNEIRLASPLHLVLRQSFSSKKISKFYPH
jgi:hypothetical protein